MAYNLELAERIRIYLSDNAGGLVTEKKMFGGLAFMVDEKMCINVSGDNLMCRFDPALSEEISERIGFLPMTMRGKEYKGYCYVEPQGFSKMADFVYWINLCLEFNSQAKSSKK